MHSSFRIALGAAVLMTVPTLGALAQSAAGGTSGGSSSAPSATQGTASPTPSNPAPSAGVPNGRPAIGPETQAEKDAQEKSKRDTTICNGC